MQKITNFRLPKATLCAVALWISPIFVQAQAPPTSVSTFSIEKGPVVRSTSQPASVHPFFEANLASRVSGYVKTVEVDIGGQVKEGDILALIDTPELVTQAERKEAEIELLRSKTKELEAGTLAVKAETHAEELEYERVSRLAASGTITKSAGDEALSRLESARAKMAVVTAEVEGSRAAVKVATKELEELRTKIGFASLKAPFAGTVTHRSLDPGDLVKSADAAGQEGPLFRIARLDKVRIKTSIPELDSVYVNAGDIAKFECRALKGKVFDGTVARTAGSIEMNSGSMSIEIDLENADGTLIPGLFGTATIELERFENAITLPANSVRFDEKGGNPTVYLVEGGTVKVVPVETGYDDGNQIQILKGLTGSEQVISGMLGRFAGGESVTVRTPEKTGK